MKNSSVYLRRFLLFVFYTNISATSIFIKEGVKEARKLPILREKWPGNSGGSSNHVSTEPTGFKKQAVHMGNLRLLTSSSFHVVSPRLASRDADKKFQKDEGQEEGEEDEERDRGRLADYPNERRTVAATRKGRRRHSFRDCWKQLDLDIDTCLMGYERMLRNVTSRNKEQLSKPFKIELCREYEEMMQCIHLSFAKCPPGRNHLHLFAYHVGYLKTFMEQTCEENEYDEEEEKETEEQSLVSVDDRHSSTAISNLTSLNSVAAQNDTTAVTSIISTSQFFTTLSVISMLSNTSTSSTYSAGLNLSSTVFGTSKASGLSTATSTSSALNSTPVGTLASVVLASNDSVTSSVIKRIVIKATPDLPARDHLTHRYDGECNDNSGCRGGERREKEQMDTWPMTNQTTVVAANVPFKNKTTRFAVPTGKVTENNSTSSLLAPREIEAQITPPSTSAWNTTETDYRAGGTQSAPQQCQPGVTCTITSSAGNGCRNDSDIVIVVGFLMPSVIWSLLRSVYEQL